jgi:hypothetical protein
MLRGELRRKKAGQLSAAPGLSGGANDFKIGAECARSSRRRRLRCSALHGEDTRRIFEASRAHTAHENGVLLRFIEPGKPNQNAYVNRLIVGSAMNVSMSTGSPASSTQAL